MKRARRGFTLVELMVVIVVIGILATIAAVSFTRYQAKARDDQRHTQAMVIAHGLETYYSKNGEYPGCPQLTGSVNSVIGTGDALQGVNATALVTPQAPSGTTNSIKCQDLTSASGGDIFAYVGDNSADCNTGASCLEFTLKYINEETGGVDSIVGRHQQKVATSGTLTLALSGTTYTSTNLAWNAVSNATSYQIQSANDANFTQNVSTTSTVTTSKTMSSLAPGTIYYYRVRAVSSTSNGDWSNVVNTTTNFDTPANNAVVATSATTFKQSWSAVTGATGYRIRCSTDNANWSGCTATTGALSYNYTGALQGQKYYVQVQAYTNYTSSAWTSSATTITPMNQPATPTWAGPGSITASTPGGAYYYYGINYTTYCPAGSWVANGNFTSVYTYDWSQFNHPFGYTDYWYLPYGQSSVIVYYYGRYQCATSYTTSAVSPDSFNAISVHN